MIMKKYTLEQYKKLAKSFNSKNFKEQIEILIKHTHILKLCNDYNWWVVKVIDEEIQNELEEQDETFVINQEWGYNEIDELLDLLKIKRDGL